MSNNKISSVTEYLLKMDEMDMKKHTELLEKIDELQQRIEELEAQNAYECECNKEYAETIKKNDELEHQLDIATKALKEYSLTKNWFVEGFVYYDVDAFEDEELAQKALKEMEEV